MLGLPPDSYLFQAFFIVAFSVAYSYITYIAIRDH